MPALPCPHLIPVFTNFVTIHCPGQYKSDLILLLESVKYGEQYRFVFGCLLPLKVRVDEDKPPLPTISPVTSLCPEANEGFNITVLRIIEF